jgi:hypothetical protein
VAEEKICSLSEELSLLQPQGSDLCLSIVGPSRVRNHLSEMMQAATLHHTKMVGEFASLLAVESSAPEMVLGRSPNEPFQAEITDELVGTF